MCYLPRPMERANTSAGRGTDFIRQIVAADLESGRHGGRVVTRFPPEPNGYLHVGHATHICLNFGIAEEFGGRCHLRYDDTNPEKESEDFVRAIQEDIRWLGFDWGEHLYFASDYFERMYQCAESLIERGLAYVDSQPTEAIREGRGTVTESGVLSRYRGRSPEENLDLFRRMRAGEFEDGEHVLRGKIDMASPNMLMRDPVFYRIRHAHHYRQGDDWCIYPLYDYAHCLEDAFEGVTHSICTLEFENNRELYDWVLEHVGFEEPRPHQYEWAGLDLEGAVLSKRFIKPLVDTGVVSGWNDPRLATVAAYRRRGVPPEALRLLSDLIGVSKTGAKTEEAKLDFAIREVLNPTAPRVMAVLDPLKVVLTNFPADQTDEIDAPLFPHDVPREGSRHVPFTRELWIERTDFEEDPPEGFRRLVPGGEVRLRYAYVICCDEVIKDESGRVVELRCRYDPDTQGGATGDGRKVKGTIQWVSVPHALAAEVRLFDRLLLDFDIAELWEDEPFDPSEHLNPSSLVVVPDARIEPSVANDPSDTRYQFERTGYFWRDPVDGLRDRPVFNRIVALKDTWARREAAPARAPEGTPPKTGGTRSARRGAPGRRRDEPPAAPESTDADADRRARDLSPEIAMRIERYRSEFGVIDEHAELLARSPDFFEAALGEHRDATAVASWIVVDLRGLLGDRTLSDLPFGGEAVGRLAALVDAGKVSRRAAKDVLARMIEEGGQPEAWVESMGLEKMSDREALGAIIESVLAGRPDKVAEYRGGKKGLIGFFVGEVMKQSGGAADPARAKHMLSERLDR
ncbi:MAG TPA: glutamine--tRNA ligase/YqeY domain fusion protein [Longimicrobiales bacterium]|nr:glutamine--tRNA ligase/YqeY domain fusion protein [Longimicrobiales bacterium]